MEHKNRILEELVRIMLNDGNLPKYFLVDTIRKACYVLNRILIPSILDKAPYELLKDKKPNLSYIHVFRCKCFF